MELPTYTSIWRIEKRLYKLYDFRLPMPLPVGQIAVFTAITVPYIVLLTVFGLPFDHNLFWLYVLPPGLLTWLATRPVLESKRLPELLTSQVRYISEPSTWARMAPLAEKDDVIIFSRVWRRATPALAAVPDEEVAGQEVPARQAGRARVVASPARRSIAAPWPQGGAAARGAAAQRSAAAQRDAAAARLRGRGRALPGTTRSAAAAVGYPEAAGYPGAREDPAAGRSRAPDMAEPAGYPEVAVGYPDVSAGYPEVPVGYPAMAPDPEAYRHARPVRAEAVGYPEVVSEPGQRPGRREAPGAAGPAGYPDVTWATTRPAARSQPARSQPVQPQPVQPQPARSQPAWSQPERAAEPARQPAAWPARQPEVAHDPRPAARTMPRGTAVPTGYPEPAVPTGYPEPAVPTGYPEPAVPTGYPSPATPTGYPETATPTGYPETATPTGYAPRPAAAPPQVAPPPVAPPPVAPPPAAPRPAEEPRSPAVGRPGGPVRLVPAQRSAAGPPPVRPAPQRPAPGVERVLGGPATQRGTGWRNHVTVVPGGRGPGRPDHEKESKARAVLPLDGPRLVVVLGCTVGAGQTVTTLMLAELLASLRGEPVAALDLNPGPASLAELAKAPATTVSALLAGRPPGAHAAGARPGSPSASPRPASARPASAGQQTPARGPAAIQRGARTQGRLDVISQDADAAVGAHAAGGNGAPPSLQHSRMLDILASRYLLTLADPGASAVARVLAAADQLVLVAPASADAAQAVSMTCEWLGGHGRAALAAHSIAVINGVSRRSVHHAEQAEQVLRGRCRAIVRVPWDNHLAEPEAERGIRDSLEADGGQSRLGRLHPAVLQAYIALAGVLVGALVDGPARPRAAR